MSNLKIIDAAYYIPEKKISSQDIENNIKKKGLELKKGIIEKLTGVKTRYHRNENDFPSTLAAEACKKIIKNNKEKINLLIFSSTSRDVYEPATSNLVQYFSGLDCPTFDISNACNSYLSGISVANAFIKSGMYKNILLCTGETSSIAIDWNTKNKKDLIAGTTLGDAGVAMLLGETDSEEIGIKYEFFATKGELWEDITVKGGGARFPRSTEETYFKSDLDGSIGYYKENGLFPFLKGLEISGWSLSDIDKIFFHQASKNILLEFKKQLGAPEDKIYTTFCDYGNTASASIPLGYAIEKSKGNIKPGEKIVFICPAAGLSYGIIFIQN